MSADAAPAPEAPPVLRLGPDTWYRQQNQTWAAALGVDWDDTIRAVTLRIEHALEPRLYVEYQLPEGPPQLAEFRLVPAVSGGDQPLAESPV